jgi:hypothetical protein
VKLGLSYQVRIQADGVLRVGLWGGYSRLIGPMGECRKLHKVEICVLLSAVRGDTIVIGTGFEWAESVWLISQIFWSGQLFA